MSDTTAYTVHADVVPDDAPPGLWADTAAKLLRMAAADVRRLTAERDSLLVALANCANDLEASVDAEYHGTLGYPSQRRRYERDMEPVRAARKLLVVHQQDRP